MKLVSPKSFNGFFSLLGVGIFIAFTAFAIMGDEGLLRLMELRKTRDELKERNRELLLQNFQLRQEQAHLYKPKSMERLARESLGFVYPDEVVFVEKN